MSHNNISTKIYHGNMIITVSKTASKSLVDMIMHGLKAKDRR